MMVVMVVIVWMLVVGKTGVDGRGHWGEER